MRVMRVSFIGLCIGLSAVLPGWSDTPNEGEGPEFSPPPSREARRGEAEHGPRPPGAGGGPIFRALDADRDGKLSADEIAGAENALKSLDKDGDGEITREEVAARGARPEGRRPRPDRPRPDDFPGRGGPDRRGPEGRGDEPRGPREFERPEEHPRRRPPEEWRQHEHHRHGESDRDSEFRRERPERGRAGDEDRPGSREPRERPRWNSEAEDRLPPDRRSAIQDQFLQRVMQRDANGNGKLEGDEIPQPLKEHMEMIDGNRDGVLDDAELRAAAVEIREKLRGRGRALREERRRERPEAEPSQEAT